MAQGLNIDQNDQIQENTWTIIYWSLGLPSNWPKLMAKNSPNYLLGNPPGATYGRHHWPQWPTEALYLDPCGKNSWFQTPGRYPWQRKKRKVTPSWDPQGPRREKQFAWNIGKFTWKERVNFWVRCVSVFWGQFWRLLHLRNSCTVQG